MRGKCWTISWSMAVAKQPEETAGSYRTDSVTLGPELKSPFPHISCCYANWL